VENDVTATLDQPARPLLRSTRRQPRLGVRRHPRAAPRRTAWPVRAHRPRRTPPPHAVVRLPPADCNGIFAWLAAYALLGLNDITVKATPGQALALVRAAEKGDLDEPAIAAQLAAFSGTDPR
jgi:hypothetical protein